MAERRITSTQERRFIYVPGDVDQDTQVELRVTARVRGTGVRVRVGTEAMVTATERFMVTRVLRDFVAPTFDLIGPPGDVLEGSTHPFQIISAPVVTADGVGDGAKVATRSNNGRRLTVTWLWRGSCYSVGETITFTQGDAVATYTLTAADITPIGALNDLTNVTARTVSGTFNSSLAGGDYDTATYAWTIVSGGGQFVGGNNTRVVQYRAPVTPTNVDVVLQCVVTARGTGASGQRGNTRVGSDTSTHRFEFTAIDHIDTVAPFLDLNNVVGIIEGRTQVFRPMVFGGTYDTISYAWRIVSGGGSLDIATGDMVVYTAPAVSVDTPAEIECVATARGTGTNSDPQTTDSVTATEQFNIIALLPVSAPSLQLTDPGTVRGLLTTIRATPSGGSYDDIAYAWQIVSGGGSLTADRDRATHDSTGLGNVEVVISCTATVRGTGVNHEAGTTATVTASRTLRLGTNVVAEAGGTQRVAIGATVRLMASADVIRGVGDTAFSWQQTAGLTAPLSDPAIADPTFVFPSASSLYVVTPTYLESLNPTTGVATQISRHQFGIGGSGARAVTEHNRIVYMILLVRGDWALATLDLSNGMATRVGNVTNFNAGVTTPLALLSYRGRLYMTAGASLYILNTATGSATRYTATTVELSEMAVLNGVVYALGQESGSTGLYTLTPGVVNSDTKVADLGSFIRPLGLTDYNNGLYLVDRNTLYQVNPRTGVLGTGVRIIQTTQSLTVNDIFSIPSRDPVTFQVTATNNGVADTDTVDITVT